MPWEAFFDVADGFAVFFGLPAGASSNCSRSTIFCGVWRFLGRHSLRRQPKRRTGFVGIFWFAVDCRSSRAQRLDSPVAPASHRPEVDQLHRWERPWFEQDLRGSEGWSCSPPCGARLGRSGSRPRKSALGNGVRTTKNVASRSASACCP